MADKGHQGFANMDEERQREVASAGGHASHEKGAAHEFNSDQASEAGRRGTHAHAMSHASANRESAENGGESEQSGEGRDASGAQPNGGEGGGSQRSRRTRGGTHDQHVTAGKKGGSRIRQLIELGYKYEQEHGIGPGQNERSKLAAKRRTSKGGGDEDEGQAGS